MGVSLANSAHGPLPPSPSSSHILAPCHYYPKECLFTRISQLEPKQLFDWSCPNPQTGELPKHLPGQLASICHLPDEGSASRCVLLPAVTRCGYLGRLQTGQACISRACSQCSDIFRVFLNQMQFLCNSKPMYFSSPWSYLLSLWVPAPAVDLHDPFQLLVQIIFSSLPLAVCHNFLPTSLTSVPTIASCHLCHFVDCAVMKCLVN